MRENRLSGIVGGLTETWVMGVGLRPAGKPVDEPPNPKTERAVFLSRPPGNRCFYLEPDRRGRAA